MAVKIQVLGPLEVVVDGRALPLGPHRQRALLALLVLRANQVVATERILEELWGDDAVDKERALWVYVSRLRSALEPGRVQRGESNVIRTRDRGYVLEVEPATIDAFRFEEGVRSGQALVRDDPEAGSAALAEALGLWRGAALQDFAYDDFARADIARLEELRLVALEDRIEADLRRGEARTLVAELEELRDRQPLRERPVRQLMLALYRAGRQAEALRAFERFRRHVGEELGTTPSPELCRLDEQILLHDVDRGPGPAPAPGSAGVAAAGAAENPYKGLHPFREADAGDFFGRERLVADVVGRLAAGDTLVALVGPSGSGKSSAVRAGVVPALRRGAVPGSESWLVAPMIPGARPFAELEAALLRAAVDGPGNWSRDLWADDAGLLRAALRIVPDERSPVLLVVDQFEELFTSVESQDDRRRFVDNLLTAVDDPHGRVRVLLTLRADAYHLPLEHAAFGARLGDAVLNVVPLLPDELELAAQSPAARAGVTLEAALLAELLSDVVGQPGALPIFQYALTELYDRRDGDAMTVASYRAMGGVRGALRQRAEDVFAQLDDAQRDAAEQLFLRLVTISEHDQWTRRRVFASEILSLELDVTALQVVIEVFGHHRFLAFDRDPVSAAPTLEVAHEALLREWERLQAWIDEARADVRRHATLAVALQEWVEAAEDADYLLSGARLAEYERWRAGTRMRLTTSESRFLDASAARRDETRAGSDTRSAEQATLRRRARRRLWALVAAVVALGTVALAPVLASDPAPSSVVLVHLDEGNISGLGAAGLADARRRHGVDVTDLAPPFGDVEADLREAVSDGADLVVALGDSFAAPVAAVAADHPEVTWVGVEPGILGTAGAANVDFAEEEGAALAGAAAALASETGTIGFVGGHQSPQLEAFRAGYEAGARAVDPDVRVLATYASASGDGFHRDDLARAAAGAMYDQGADVVFHAAGRAGLGVMEAARASSVATGRHRWAIGVDSDQYLDVDEALRPYVLTSMVKRYDHVTARLIDDFLAGDLGPGPITLRLADDAMTLAGSGGYLSAGARDAVDELRQAIVAGDVEVPVAPSGPLAPPPGTAPATTVRVDYDGRRCTYSGPATVAVGETLHLDLHNTTAADAGIVFEEEPWVAGTAVPVPARGRADGYHTVSGSLRVRCFPSTTSPDGAVSGAELDVAGRT